MPLVISTNIRSSHTDEGKPDSRNDTLTACDDVWNLIMMCEVRGGVTCLILSDNLFSDHQRSFLRCVCVLGGGHSPDGVILPTGYPCTRSFFMGGD